MSSPLVSCEWLKGQLDNPNIRILDGWYQYQCIQCIMILLHCTTGTWNQPAWGRNAQQEYLDCHIQGAVRFDIATIRDTDAPLPLTIPTAAQFTEHVQKV